MTRTERRIEPLGPPVLDREAVFRSFTLLAVLLGLLLLPILGHGCHGDDLDLEPGSQPAEVRP